MKPSSRDSQLGLASPLNYAANKSGKIKIESPSKKEAGAGCKSPALASREGTGETFFLDILFHRMSERQRCEQESLWQGGQSLGHRAQECGAGAGQRKAIAGDAAEGNTGKQKQGKVGEAFSTAIAPVDGRT